MVISRAAHTNEHSPAPLSLVSLQWATAPPTSQKTLRDQQVGLAQAPMKCFFPQAPVCLRLVCALQEWHLLPPVLWRSRDRALATASASESRQSCPTLCDPWDGSPPGSAVPGILQARTLECVAISLSNAWKWKVKLLSRVRLWVTPWTAAHQAPPSLGFSRQEHWSGLHCLLRDQALLAFKARCSCGSSSQCQTPRISGL